LACALTASFQTLAAPPSSSPGRRKRAMRRSSSASEDVKWTDGISLAGVFEGEFSGQTRGYAGKGVVRYSW
jgi:hypothetical protein